MKKLEEIYDKVASDNIEVERVHFNKVKACALQNDYNKVIALGDFESSDEELIALYHEYIHLKYGLMYDENTDKALIDKLEYKVNKHVFNDLIPIKTLEELYKRGNNIYEIAEILEVPLFDVMTAEFLYGIKEYVDE